jgi:hypothetical protein
MRRVTRLAREVAAKLWPPIATRFQQTGEWVRHNPRTALWLGGVIVAVALLVLLITHWNPYKAQHEAFAPIFTLVAGLAIAGVTLMRHFAQTEADRPPGVRRAVSLRRCQSRRPPLPRSLPAGRASAPEQRPERIKTAMRSVRTMLGAATLGREAVKASAPRARRQVRWNLIGGHVIFRRRPQPSAVSCVVDRLWARVSTRPAHVVRVVIPVAAGSKLLVGGPLRRASR